MVYTNYPLGLTEHEVMALAHGGAIKVHPHMHKGHHVHVTLGQHHRLMNSRRTGRPITLKMTNAQFRHNAKAKMGGGFFSDIWDRLKHGARSAYDFLAPVAKKAAVAAYEHATPIAQERATQIAKRLGAAATQRASALADKIADKIESGVARAEKAISGNGRRKRGGHLMLYNDPVYNTGPYRMKGGLLYNDPVYNTGPYRMKGTGRKRKVKGRGMQSTASRLLAAQRIEAMRAAKANPPTHGNGRRRKRGGACMPYNDPVYNTGPYRMKGGAFDTGIGINGSYVAYDRARKEAERKAMFDRAHGGSLEGESGGNLWDDIWGGVKKGVKVAAQIANPLVGFIPGIGPVAQLGLKAATHVLGNGRKRKRKVGGSFRPGNGGSFRP